MRKEYTYTRAVEIDFDYIIKQSKLKKEDASLNRCWGAVYGYIIALDDCDYYIIDNIDEIARDLYDYIQSKK